MVKDGVIEFKKVPKPIYCSIAGCPEKAKVSKIINNKKIAVCGEHEKMMKELVE